jgi:hypothetical protein
VRSAGRSTICTTTVTSPTLSLSVQYVFKLDTSRLIDTDEGQVAPSEARAVEQERQVEVELAVPVADVLHKGEGTQGVFCPLQSKNKNRNSQSQSQSQSDAAAKLKQELEVATGYNRHIVQVAATPHHDGATCPPHRSFHLP